MASVKLKSNSANEDRRSYSRAVCVGDMIFVANTAGRNFSTREMSADPREQALQCIANIRGALEALDSGLEDIVRTRIAIPFLEHKEAVMAVVAETFRGIDPAATITACPLASTEYLVEIEVTAYRGAGKDIEHRTVTLD